MFFEYALISIIALVFFLGWILTISSKKEEDERNKTEIIKKAKVVCDQLEIVIKKQGSGYYIYKRRRVGPAREYLARDGSCWLTATHTVRKHCKFDSLFQAQKVLAKSFWEAACPPEDVFGDGIPLVLNEVGDPLPEEKLCMLDVTSKMLEAEERGDKKEEEELYLQLKELHKVDKK